MVQRWKSTVTEVNYAVIREKVNNDWFFIVQTLHDESRSMRKTF